MPTYKSGPKQYLINLASMELATNGLKLTEERAKAVVARLATAAYHYQINRSDVTTYFERLSPAALTRLLQEVIAEAKATREYNGIPEEAELMTATLVRSTKLSREGIPAEVVVTYEALKAKEESVTDSFDRGSMPHGTKVWIGRLKNKLFAQLAAAGLDTANTLFTLANS